ncbi:MAG: hypothetical protein Q7R53_02685 [bacterium]|nr:hypothetical protein [bacterium]
MIPLKIQAIQTALKGDWKTAISLNKEILKENPEDIETFNRIALALTALGKIKEAKSHYQQVLKLDSQNLIATKNLKRLAHTPAKAAKSSMKIKEGTLVLTETIEGMFLEESGKTKVVELVNVADSKTISFLRIGEALNISIKRFKIYALDKNMAYVGMLPDDISRRLIKFLKGGNAYHTHVKCIENNRITIFIKEIKRSSRFKNHPSFTTGAKTKVSFSAYQEKNQLDEDESAEEE